MDLTVSCTSINDHLPLSSLTFNAFDSFPRPTSCVLDKKTQLPAFDILSIYLSLASNTNSFNQLSFSVSLFSKLITMSAIEMASDSKVPYQRLRNEGGLDLYEDYECQRAEKVLFNSRPRSFYRFRKVSFRRRFKLKVPSLRRILRRRAKLASAIRVSLGRVVKRLKESQSHLNELFAGNYLFLQINPPSLKCLDKGGHNLHGLSSRYSIPRIA